MLLRAEFNRRDHGRWRALLPFALGVSNTPVPAAAVVAILMTPTTKVLSAAAVLVVAACLVFSWDRNELPPEFTGRQAGTPAAATAGVTVADNEGADERILVTEAITQVSPALPRD
jgi:uncharacterized RDD family membrane protein YckC